MRRGHVNGARQWLHTGSQQPRPNPPKYQNPAGPSCPRPSPCPCKTLTERSGWCLENNMPSLFLIKSVFTARLTLCCLAAALALAALRVCLISPRCSHLVAFWPPVKWAQLSYQRPSGTFNAGISGLRGKWWPRSTGSLPGSSGMLPVPHTGERDLSLHVPNQAQSTPPLMIQHTLSEQTSVLKDTGNQVSKGCVSTKPLQEKQNQDFYFCFNGISGTI